MPVLRITSTEISLLSSQLGAAGFNLHLFYCARLLCVMLKASTLEVLHLERFVTVPIPLHELFRNRVTELRECAMCVPVI